MFNRRIYKEVLRWKERYAPRYALFLKGARRVGKTTLAEKLGKEAYRSYLRISFDQAEQGVKDLFLNLPPCYHGGFILTDRKLFRRDLRMDNPTGRHFLHRTFAEDLFPVPQALSPAAS